MMPMPALAGLTPDIDSAVHNELRDGEELWYAGMPSPSRMGRKMWPIALFGLFFGGFAAFWITMAAAGVWFGAANATEKTGSSGAAGVAAGVFMLFPLFGLPFLLIGLAMISSPFWVGRKARRTACCVTNQRAMQIECGRSIKVQSWSALDLDEISKTLHPDGTGSLTFASSLVQRAKGGVREVAQGFYGVPDPRACEEALLALKATSRSASDPRTEA
jgi:hypothetical protein